MEIPPTEEKRYQTFEEFWPFYLSQHAHPTCRILHVVGTTLALLVFLRGIRHGHWTAVFPALIIAYGFAWFGHFIFEKNRPATFTYPKWSFIGDFRMLKLFYTGKLNAELSRLQISWPPKA